MNNLDLIKTVRGLDQTGPGANGENLQRLWSLLTSIYDTGYHAAEETTLRWLLKSMNGPSPSAEIVRRYPLTWTILACVVQRIPLFSLAKSLADRKFIAVLQQTLKDISKPTTAHGSPASPKRKRHPTVGYDLTDLQARHGCLETAREVFKTLQTLLARLEINGTDFTRDKIGAEHIKSRFGTSAAEATRIAAPALAVCAMLASDSSDNPEGSESWIATVSTIWDLHLQAADDAIEVATHLFTPSATILARIGSFPTDFQVETPEPLKGRWRADLEAFMHRNLIFPGKATFMGNRTFEAFDRALEISKSIIQLSASALYFLSAGGSNRIAKGEMRKDTVEWLKQMFKAVELMIRERPDRSILMQRILEQAIQQSKPVDVDDLRRVCRDYALQGAETDWKLVSAIATCDPDVFQLGEDGINLRQEVCRRITTREASSGHHSSISEVIYAILDGFRTLRALPGFMRLWFEQLCEEERRELSHGSPWSRVGQPTSPKPLGSFLEAELSPPQLLDIISWIQTEKLQVYPHSVCVFSSAIAQALRSEPFVDAVGRRLFDLVAHVDGSATTSALKWRVASSTISWMASKEKVEIWDSVKSHLSKILKSSPIVSSVTFEAFKCCFQAWDSLSLDESQADEAASLIEKFLKRLAKEETFALASGECEHKTFAELDISEELRKDSAHEQYLRWYLYGSSRFARLYFHRKGHTPKFLSNVLSAREAGVGRLETLWHALLRNEINCDEPKMMREFIDRLVASLDKSDAEKTWPGEQHLALIKILASIPSEVFSREQRERLMDALSKQRPKMVRSPDQVSLDGWRCIISLATKMMGRPTFYHEMSFSDLVEIASAVSCVSTKSSSSHEIIVELTGRFFRMASATIRQMAEHWDERSIKYFREASKFVSDFKTQKSGQSGAGMAGQALFMTLLKALTMELARSPHLQSHQEMASLTADSKSALGSCIANIVSSFISDKKLLTSSGTAADMSLLAAVDAADTAEDVAAKFDDLKSPTVGKFEKRSRQSMQQGDLRAWKLQIFLRAHLSTTAEIAPLVSYESLETLPPKLRQPLLTELVTATTRHMSSNSEKCQYLRELLDGLRNGCGTDGQVLAVQIVVDQIIDSADHHEKTDGFGLAGAHSELTLLLTRKPRHATRICNILQTMLERRPQAMGQWNIDVTLSTVCRLCSADSDESVVPFTWLCKLVEAVIKKHRLRLEGHYHILLSALQALIRNLVAKQIPASAGDERGQQSKTHAYARLISLICEPTAGAVSRSQRHSALDSATDAAKRSAGRHMYLVMMQFVKLQLEYSVPRAVGEAMEPAVHSIFDITPPEGRKILNDAMDAGGRAILRQMYKRYVQFGKWSGV